MRTIIKEIKAYKFEELSKEVQNKVLDMFRETQVDYNWSEFTIDDWQAVLAKMGFDDAKISFSGFYSQGDGASFECKRVDSKKLLTFLEMGQEQRNELLGFEIKGLVMTDKFKRLLKVLDCFGLSVDRMNSHYVHQNSSRVSVDFHTRKEYKRLDALIYDFREYAEDLRLDLSKRIYKELQTEYEYLTSDEAIKECIQANDYEFEEHGKIIHE